MTLPDLNDLHDGTHLLRAHLRDLDWVDNPDHAVLYLTLAAPTLSAT